VAGRQRAGSGGLGDQGYVLQCDGRGVPTPQEIPGIENFYAHESFVYAEVEGNFIA
jgi:hypothetical protein